MERQSIDDRGEPPIEQEEFVNAMVKHLPVLRASIRITQRELAQKIGITRQSMMAIETGKRPLQWSNYLALVCVFQQYDASADLLDKLKLFTSGIITKSL